MEAPKLCTLGPSFSFVNVGTWVENFEKQIDPVGCEEAIGFLSFDYSETCAFKLNATWLGIILLAYIVFPLELYTIAQLSFGTK